MGNALSMDLRVRFRNLMDGGFARCGGGQDAFVEPRDGGSVGQAGPGWRASGTAAVGAAQGQRQTGVVCLVLRGADRAGPRHHSG